jgi:hypothetical protein
MMQDHQGSTHGCWIKLFTALPSSCHFDFPEGQSSMTKRHSLPSAHTCPKTGLF